MTCFSYYFTWIWTYNALYLNNYLFDEHLEKDHTYTHCLMELDILQLLLFWSILNFFRIPIIIFDSSKSNVINLHQAYVLWRNQSLIIHLLYHIRGRVYSNL